MAMAIPIMMMVGVAVSAVSAIRQGQAAQAAANYNAQVDQQNAAQARSDALANSIQVSRDNLLRLGSIRAARGAGGGTGAGSTLDVLADVAAQGELERQWTIYQGESRARGHQNTATLDVAQGRAARDAGVISGVGTAISGFAAAGMAGRELSLGSRATPRRVG